MSMLNRDNQINNVGVGLIVFGIVIIMLILGSIFYSVWHVYQIGNLNISSDQTDVAYQVSGDVNTYTGTEVLSGLKKGIYKINAYGLTPGIYLPKTLTVEVKGRQTTNLNIILELDPNGYNHGGVEGP